MGKTMTLPVKQGGTGSKTPEDARTAISAAASGANSDITSLTGLTPAAKTAIVEPAPITAGGVTRTLPDHIVAGAQQATLAAQAARDGAVSDVRGGVAPANDTLAKLAATIAVAAQGTFPAATLAQLNANTTALQGTVDSDGANNGSYARTARTDPSTPWVRVSTATVPGIDARTNFIGYDDGAASGYLYTLFTELKQVLYQIDLDGTFLAKLGIVLGNANGLAFSRGADGRYTLSFGDALGRIPAGGGVIDPSVATTEGDLYALVDALNRMILLVTGQGHVQGVFEDFNGVRYATLNDIGAPAALTARVDRGLDAYGVPLSEVYRPDRLREAHRRFAVLRDYGGVLQGQNCQVGHLFQGDSWSTTQNYWIGPLTRRLVAAYGDAGPGWTGFGFTSSGTVNGNARPDVLFYAKTGSWVATYGTAPMLDHCMVTSGASGDTLSLTYTKPAGGPDLTAVDVFAIASNTATAQYRINGGAWTALDLTGTGFKLLSLTPPAGSFSLDIQALSAGVQLGGANFRSSAKGVVVHKAGASGTRSSQWASVDATIYQAALAALAPHVVSLLTGTNSQSSYDPDADRGYLQTVINRWKAALPLADKMLVTPPENARSGNAYPMSAYAAGARRLAYDNGLTHLDLQPSFGDAVADYAAGSARPLLDPTLIHPSNGDDPATGRGGLVIANRVARLLETA